MSSQGGTIYILGAGASRHAGYPFIASMGPELFAWMRRRRETIVYDFAACADELDGRFGDNIENVLKGIDAAIRRRGHDRTVFANYHRPALLEAMRQWFADIQREHAATAYGQFATEIVRPGDHIITFNYDVAPESCLRRAGKWCIGDGYGFVVEGLPCGSLVSILKLHGSINWFAILFRGMTGTFTSSGGAFGHRPAFCDMHRAYIASPIESILILALMRVPPTRGLPPPCASPARTRLFQSQYGNEEQSSARLKSAVDESQEKELRMAAAAALTFMAFS